MDEIQNNPITVNDSEFDGKIKDARTEVDQLYEKAKQKLTGDDSQMQLQVCLNNLDILFLDFKFK